MRLRRDAKADLIASVPLFARCSKRELSRIAGIADQVELPKGKVLVRQGELASEFYVIIDGSVEVEKDGRHVADFGPGDFVGEIALLETLPRTATVRTTSDVQALVVAGRDFWTLLDSAPGLQRKLLETMAERLSADAV